MKRFLAGMVLVAGGVLLAAPALAKGEVVLRLDLDGTVDPLAARYIDRGLREAEGTGAAAVVLRIDTPGGLDSSMRQIIRGIQASRVPVVCWVGPAGARAASAGAVILTGCPIAAMAPGTNVGAAHPVGFRGEVLADKITNDAAAYIRSLAERWERNADLAESMVRTSVSVSANEALVRDAIDLLAPGIDELLGAIDGRTARVGGDATATIEVTEAAVLPFEMSFLESLLHNAIDPNLAFLLLTLGLGAIVFEILHPGIQVAGIFGSLAVIVSLLILGMLPVNLAGMALIALGIGLFVLEAFIPGGVAGVAGLAALLAGGLLLFDKDVPNAQVSTGLVIGTAVSVAVFFLFVVRAVLASRRQRLSAATMSDLVGEHGVVERDLEPAGIARVRNESWSARTEAAPLPAGTEVRVAAVEGLTLVVEPVVAEAARE